MQLIEKVTLEFKKLDISRMKKANFVKVWMRTFIESPRDIGLQKAILEVGFLGDEVFGGGGGGVVGVGGVVEACCVSTSIKKFEDTNC